MTDRTIAGLVMLAPTALCWWLARSYLVQGEVFSGRTGNTVTRATGPKRFWTAVILTALLGCITFALALVCVFA